MNNELKRYYFTEIEWIKTSHNFGIVTGNITFIDSFSRENYEKMFRNKYFILCDEDYITNLQEENKKLKDDKDSWHRVAQRNYNELLDRIDKAIEYINNRFIYEKDTGAYYLTHTFDGSNVFDLYNILQGENNE